MVETNTFGAHRLKLAPHGYEAQVAKINREGARLAREAAQGRGLVAGSMGPLGKPLEPFGNIAMAHAVEVYREQAEGLLEGGVDLFAVETMPSLDQARAAVDAIRSLSDLPIVVSLTFNEEGTTFYGDKPEDVVRTLEDWDVQVVGANCSQGPMPMLETVQRMAAVAKRGEALRDAQRRRARPGGRPLRLPVHAGVHGVVRAAVHRAPGVTVRRAAAAGRRPPTSATSCARCACCSRRREVVTVLPPAVEKEAPAPIAARGEEPARAASWARSSWCRWSWTRPRAPTRAGSSTARSTARRTRSTPINVADGPRASARMSAQSLCVLMQGKVGIDTILHYTCRDRNLLGIQSDLLGAYALGLRNILAITGDPPKLGDYPDATAVYDVDSIGLIRIMSHLNHGCDLAGNPIGPALGIHIGCGADPSKPDHDKEIRRLEEKIKAGAEYIMTQPVYDPATVEHFLGSIKHLDVPVLIGILPLYSHKNAEFLHNEVPGMTHPRGHPRAHAEGRVRRGRAFRRRAASPRRRCARPRTWPRARTSCRPSTRWSWRSASSRGCAEARSHGIPGRTRPLRSTDRGRRARTRRRVRRPRPAARPGSVFPVRLEEVHVALSVRDAKGKLVTDLTADDFVVTEDGRPQTIQLFARGIDEGQDTAAAREALALDLGLLLDTSSSMLKELKLSQEAASRFLEAIPRARELYTIFFDEDIRVSRYDSENQQGLFDRIHAAKGGGNTALYDAIAVYLSRVQDGSGRKVLVLFTDGEDTQQRAGLHRPGEAGPVGPGDDLRHRVRHVRRQRRARACGRGRSSSSWPR